MGMNLFKLFDTEEAKIKREIMKRAIKIAEDTYRKEVMFNSLQANDLHYAIIFDLIKTAQYTGSVSITLKDGTKIEIRDDARGTLNKLDQVF